MTLREERTTNTPTWKHIQGERCNEATESKKSKDFKKRDLADYVKSIREARTGEVMDTPVSAKRGSSGRSQSGVGSVLAASPSPLPCGQKKSTADANSQVHKVEGKNNHPVIDCSLMESINLWLQKSQLICG